jgi:hypothetical protein
MPATGKVLMFADVARNLYGHWRFHRLVSGMIVVTGSIVISAMLIYTVLLGIFFAVYYALIAVGIEAPQAVLFTAALVVLTTAGFISFTIFYLRRLRDMPKRLFGKTHVGERVNETIDAFLDGLMEEAH